MKYEYKIKSSQHSYATAQYIEWLNKEGNKGWGVVGILDQEPTGRNTLLFKRTIPELKKVEPSHVYTYGNVTYTVPVDAAPVISMGETYAMVMGADGTWDVKKL